jgi:GDP-L-fucose synthase
MPKLSSYLARVNQTDFMKVFIAGHNGMVGKAINEKLQEHNNIEIVVSCKEELDLTDQENVYNFLKNKGIDVVIIAAARVGGIHANRSFPANFIFENISIQQNLIHGAHLANIDRIIFLGSSCIYPKYASQPIIEESLLTGELEVTNESYAIAKISGIQMCKAYNSQFGRDYRCLMPTNLYGPNDNFHPLNSHVLPGLLVKFHEAVSKNSSIVKVWGDGSPMREFLHVDDLASAVEFILNIPRNVYFNALRKNTCHINVGFGKDVSITELAKLIQNITGFNGQIIYDASQPNGTPRKILNSHRINSLGWKPLIDLEEGIMTTYTWYKENICRLRQK